MPPFSDGSQLCAQIHVNCRPFRESTERTAESLRPWRPGRLRQFAAIFTPTRCASLSRRSKDDDNAMRNSLVSKCAVNTNHCAELITWTTEAPTTKNQQFVGHCLHHQPGKCAIDDDSAIHRAALTTWTTEACTTQNQQISGIRIHPQSAGQCAIDDDNANLCAELITWTTEAPTTKNQQFVGHCLHHQPGKWCLWTREAEKRRHEVSMPGQVACCELVRLSRSRVVEVRATRGFTSSALPS